MFARLIRCRRRPLALTAGFLVALSMAGTAQTAAPPPLGSIWDTAGVARVLARIKNGPRTPQLVLLGFDEFGRLERLATSDSVAPPIRALLLDSLPRLVRTDSALAGLQVRLYLLAGQGLQLVPACDGMAQQFEASDRDRVERQLVATSGIVKVTLEPSDRDGRGPLIVSERIPGALHVALVVRPGGRVTGTSVTSPTAPLDLIVRGTNAVRLFHFAAVAGASWTTPCLYRTQLPVSWLPAVSQ